MLKNANTLWIKIIALFLVLAIGSSPLIVGATAITNDEGNIESNVESNTENNAEMETLYLNSRIGISVVANDVEVTEQITKRDDGYYQIELERGSEIQIAVRHDEFRFTKSELCSTSLWLHLEHHLEHTTFTLDRTMAIRVTGNLDIWEIPTYYEDELALNQISPMGAGRFHVGQSFIQGLRITGYNTFINPGNNNQLDTWFSFEPAHVQGVHGNLFEEMRNTGYLPLLWCIQRGYPEAPIGSTMWARVTVTYVNETTGRAEFSIRAETGNIFQDMANRVPAVIEWDPVGDILIQKRSANPNINEGNPAYTLQGAVFGLFTTSGNEITRGTTNANGEVRFTGIIVGTYIVRELTPPRGFAIDNTPLNVTVRANDVVTLVVDNAPQHAPTQRVVSKIDYDLGDSTPQGLGTLEGAEFTVRFYHGFHVLDPASFGQSPVRTWVFRTNGNGFVNFNGAFLVSGNNFFTTLNGAPTLPRGTVTIQETTAPQGYLIDSTVHVKQIRDDHSMVEQIESFVAPIVPNRIMRGGVRIAKWDIELNEQRPQGGATLEGTEFTIINRNPNPVVVGGETFAPNAPIMTIATNENGIAETARRALPYGIYNVIETNPPQGYLNSGVINRMFRVSYAGEMVELNTCDTAIKNQVIRGGVRIAKWDIELNELYAQGGATLEGTEFTIINRNPNPVVVDGEVFLPNAPVMTIITNEEGIAITPDRALPYGLYNIVETRSPQGYLNAGITSRMFRITHDGKTVELTTDSTAIKNQVIRGDIRGVKIDSNGQRLDGVPFLIESMSTGESHIIVTDYNGEFGTSAIFAYRGEFTNRGELWSDGIWFGGRMEDGAEIRNFEDGVPVGALPFDLYRITELESDHDVLLPEPFYVRVSRHSHNINIGTVTNVVTPPEIPECPEEPEYPCEPEEPEYPEDNNLVLRTLMSFVKNGEQVLDLDTIDLTQPIYTVDRVWFEGAIVGENYTVKGIKMCPDTGNVILIDGEPIRGTYTFIAQTEYGYIDVEFRFILADFCEEKLLDGFRTVTFEDMYDSSGNRVGYHRDLECADQTLEFIRTPEEPVPEPSSDAPQTGDNTRIGFLILALVISAFALLGFAIYKKKIQKKS